MAVERIRGVQSQEYRYKAGLIFYYCSITLIIVIISQVAFKSTYQVQYRESSQLFLVNSLNLAVCDRLVHCKFPIHIPNESIIIGLGHLVQFLGQYITSSQPRFFLTQSKYSIEEEIFCIRHQYSQKPSPAWIEKINFKYKVKNVFVSYFKNIWTHTLFLDQIHLCCSVKVRD